MSQNLSPNPTFYMGITMAGAGSAGCYTGGAMDYLFEILDLWEKAKKDKHEGNLPEEVAALIPDHCVLIDVMGGTSAGGMTTTMAAIYALNGQVNPVKDPAAVGGIKNNIFYDSWVALGDDDNTEGRKTLEKCFDNEDMQEGKFVSLLNSKVIDEIADRAFTVQGDLEKNVANLPSYFSKNIDILHAHTMLRGIPLSLDFSTPIGEVKGAKTPSYTTFEHYMVSHYKLNEGKKPDPDNFLWLNPYDQPYAKTMAATTKATGAFPIGLKFREMDSNTFSDSYLKCVTERTIFNRFGHKDDKAKINWTNFPSPFNFVTIDGGAINNEPFGEVLGILKDRYEACVENGYPKYGIVMIDPFPDEVDDPKAYKAPDDLFTVVPAIIATLHDQSKVKRADLVEAAENPYYRGQIFPSKWLTSDTKDTYPLATGAAMAFGGFLDKAFRHHDFFLGRDNARNYFRYYFSFEYTPLENIVHPIHRSWTPQMIAMYKISSRDGKTYLPIIPDLNIIEEKKAGGLRDHKKHSVPNKPQYNPAALFNLRGAMENRFVKILETSKAKIDLEQHKMDALETAKWLAAYYHKSWWKQLRAKLINTGFNLLFSFTKKGLASKITEIAITWILNDLEEKQLLEKYQESIQ